MRHQPHLELADCRSIAAASHLAADQHQARVSIAVVDAGGHLLLPERRDGSSPASAEAAIAKARMAASREYLFRLDQPAIKIASSVAAPAAKK
jgi:uncharacterized protein GlcG (DUF336 family)